MTKGQPKPKARSAIRQGTDTGGALSAGRDDETAFAEVVGLIRAARQRAAQAVNTAVVVSAGANPRLFAGEEALFAVDARQIGRAHV